jgi:hypothetical protein
VASFARSANRTASSRAPSLNRTRTRGPRNRERRTGVYGAVPRWRDHRGVPANDLRALVDIPPEELRAAIANDGKIAGRYKTEVVHDPAVALVNCNIRTANDFREHQDDARRAYLSVNGCGPVTWAYLRMLSNADDVKADTWINRFVHDRIPDASTAQAAALVTAVALQMDVDARRLDHAIWAYRRARPR